MTKSRSWSVCVSSCVKPVKLLVALLLLAACGSLGQEAPAPQSPVHLKIATPIRRVLQCLRAAGITPAHAAQQQVAAYSTPLVHIDAHGNVHVLISVTRVMETQRTMLQAQGVRIEYMQGTVIQAWVPFWRLRAIAALPFVRYISPPHYGIRR